MEITTNRAASAGMPCSVLRPVAREHALLPGAGAVGGAPFGVALTVRTQPFFGSAVGVESVRFPVAVTPMTQPNAITAVTQLSAKDIELNSTNGAVGVDDPGRTTWSPPV